MRKQWHARSSSLGYCHLLLATSCFARRLERVTCVAIEDTLA
eukprot:COSAG06_NODE_64101_length_260_cov_0.956522_1_plen_41_part_01